MSRMLRLYCDAICSMPQELPTAACTLLQQHFRGVSHDIFHRDLHNKDFIISAWDSDRLCAFSSLASESISWQGKEIRVFYSGDTIVDPEFWQHNPLVPAWLDATRRMTATHERPFWLLICSGVRTFRLLSDGFVQRFPCTETTDPSLERLVHMLAEKRYGAAYNDGVVRLQHPQQLRGRLQHIPQHYVKDSQVQLFLNRNPGWKQGDELVCGCFLDRDNFARLGRAMLRQAERVTWTRWAC